MVSLLVIVGVFNNSILFLILPGACPYPSWLDAENMAVIPIQL